MTELHRLLDRRTLLASAPLAGLGAAALLLGCRTPDAPPASNATATPETPRRGGVLQMGQGADLLPEAGHPFALVPQNRIPAYAASETLIQFERDLTPSMLLAERFEVSADRTRATLVLKRGVEFHNGATLTADDVLFSIEVNRDPPKFGINRALELSRFAAMVKEATRRDERTIEFTFDRPRANIADFFAQLHVGHRAGYEGTNGRFIGTGPFKLKEWRKAQGFSLERFANWHGRSGEQPYLDAIEVSLFGDQAIAATAIQGGGLDAYLAVGAPNAAVVPQEHVRVAPKIGMNYLGLNVTNPAFADARVRQAIWSALDRAQIHKVAGGGFGKTTTQPWGPGSPAFEAARETAGYDPERSKTLLAQAGFKQQGPLAIEFPAGVAVQEFQAQIIEQNLRTVGIVTELKKSDAAAFTGKYRGAGFPDMWLSAHGFADLTPVTLFEQAFEFGTPNVSKYASDRYGRLLADLGSLDPLSAGAKTAYSDLNKVMLADAWVIPTGTPQIRIDLVSKRVRGWPVTPEDYLLAITGKVRFERLWIAA